MPAREGASGAADKGAARAQAVSTRMRAATLLLYTICLLSGSGLTATRYDSSGNLGATGVGWVGRSGRRRTRVRETARAEVEIPHSAGSGQTHGAPQSDSAGEVRRAVGCVHSVGPMCSVFCRMCSVSWGMCSVWRGMCSGLADAGLRLPFQLVPRRGCQNVQEEGLVFMGSQV